VGTEARRKIIIPNPSTGSLHVDVTRIPGNYLKHSGNYMKGLYTTYFNPLKPKRMRGRKSEGRVVRDTIFNGGKKKCSAVNVPRQCPVVLLIKIG
jgi:hypothetical protein